ncbi:Flagellar basal-body rod protein FlgF [hydrothermal vent metagenome]|uniref:Flagellar basal-body rod protein FlgF n=1 Tax=hydrothermal vent metagenome TaxID=652676 RepID=A0A3B1C622_9ZZZZ
MEKGSYVAVSGMLAAQRKLDTLTNNLANLSTPGFKADQMTFESYLAKSGRGEATPEQAGPTAGDTEYVATTGTYTNFEQGSIRTTGNPLDVALKGDGFLAVMTYEGERYTRAGRLQVAEDGALVTGDGHPVLDASNRMIFVNDKLVTIDDDGSVWLTDNEDRDGEVLSAGKMKLVTPIDMKRLHKEGNGLFSVPDGEEIFTASNIRVVQGSLEGSNVNMIKEMTDIIMGQRMAETYKKIVQQNDQLTTTLILQVGR